MKKIITNSRTYIPTKEELEQMKEILQHSNISTYNYNSIYDINSYCLAKKIEIILLNGGLEYFGSDIKDDYQIVSKIIKYYPADIWCTSFANDISLAKEIISMNKVKDYDIGLENINYLSSELYNNYEFIDNVIKNLLDTLRTYKEYRYNYFPNKLLDEIFEKKLSKDYLNYHYLDINNENILHIEPSYILDISDTKFQDREFSHDEEITRLRKGNALARAIRGYSLRYGIYSSYEKTNDETNKKLVKFLDEHRQNN